MQVLDKGDNHTTRVGLSPSNQKLNRFANLTVCKHYMVESISNCVHNLKADISIRIDKYSTRTEMCLLCLDIHVELHQRHVIMCTQCTDESLA